MAGTSSGTVWRRTASGRSGKRFVKENPIDFAALRTYSLHERRSLVSVPAFATPSEFPAGAWEALLDSMPDILAGESLRVLVAAMRRAHREDNAIVWGLGGHVVKVGLSPLLVDLMDRGFVSVLALNGAAAIHDAELALCGATSEDVQEGLRDGSFGMAEETAALLNGAANRAMREKEGFGRALGRELAAVGARAGPSLVLAAHERKLPVTVHVAMGQDIVHMHANADGAAIGEASLSDFRRLSRLVSDLSGGVYLNVGSAVALPEVFLKALTIARNAGYSVEDFTTANLDMLAHYRPRRNVVERPGGRGVDIRGHHEILVPLIRMGLLSALEESV